MYFDIKRAFVALLLCLGLLAVGALRSGAEDLPLHILNSGDANKRIERAKFEKEVAADPKNEKLRFDLGTVLCDLGADGDEAAADEALKLFESLNKEYPNNADILAFYGDVCTIQAKYSFVLTKLSWAHDGFKHIDDAVAASPDDLTVRIVRALNSAQVPGYLGREKTAREDFAWIMQRYQDHPKDFTDEMLRTIYYFAGKFALDHNEPLCVKLLSQASTLLPTEQDELTPKIQTCLKAALAKYPPAQTPKPPS